MQNNEQISNAVNVVIENVLASANKDKALEESTKFFGKEIVKLNDDAFRSAIHLLKDTLAERIDEFSQPIKDGRELKTNYRILIAHSINGVEGMDAEKRDILILAASDYDKFLKPGQKPRLKP